MPIVKILLILAAASLLTSAKPVSAPNTNVESIQSAQDIFSYLRCHRQGKNGISVNWGMTSLVGVTKFVVYHSEDNEFFDPVYEIDVENGTLKYSFKHDGLFAGYHYYYIAAIRMSGTGVNSMTDGVRIVGH